MLVMTACGDGEARTLFQENQIGDTDGDGAPEFLDGWGKPIGFIRWPAGFSSDIQLGPTRLLEIHADAEALDTGTPNVGNKAVTDAIAKDRDPYDIYRRDTDDGTNPTPSSSIYAHLRDKQTSYRLTPLIYSGGRDEIADINDDPSDFANLQWKSEFRWIDPYAFTLGTGVPANSQLGFPYDQNGDGDKNWIDNIDNHLIRTK